jgi:membrane-associated phospholipid phosphatase
MDARSGGVMRTAIMASWLAILSGWQPAALGQARVPQTGPRTLVRDFGRDEWKIWTSPFKRSNYDSKTVKKYVIPFALVTAALIASDNKTAELLPNTRDQTRWSGRVSQLGAAYTVLGFSGGTYLFGKATGNRHIQETGWLAVEAIAHTQVVVFALKQASNRRRPADGGGGGFWKGGNSFISGHAATSFAVASVFAYEYRHYVAVPIVAYSLASAISISRVSAQRHWVSDIVAGGTTGFVLGRFVYKRHHDSSLPGSPLDTALPRVGFTGSRVFLEWKF